MRTKRPPGRGTGLGLFCGQAPQATRNATITSPGANAPATADTGAVIANVTVSNASSVPTITVANPCTLVSTYPLNQRYHITPGNYLISWVWPGYGQEQAYYFAALGVTGDLGVPVGVFLSVYPNGQLTPDQFHTVENDSPASSWLGTWKEVPDCGITITNPTTQYNIVYGGRTDQGYLQFAAIAPDSGQVVNAVNSPAQPGTYKLFDSTLQIISVDGFKVKYQISNN